MRWPHDLPSPPPQCGAARNVDVYTQNPGHVVAISRGRDIARGGLTRTDAYARHRNSERAEPVLYMYQLVGALLAQLQARTNMCLERRSFLGLVVSHSHVKKAASSDIPTPWTLVGKSAVRFLGAGHMPTLA